MTSYHSSASTNNEQSPDADDKVRTYVSARVRSTLAIVNPWGPQDDANINKITLELIERSKTQGRSIDDILSEWESVLRSNASQRSGFANNPFGQSSIFSSVQPYIRSAIAYGLLANIDHAVSEQLKHFPEITSCKSADDSLLFEVTSFVALDSVNCNDTESLSATFVFDYLRDMLSFRGHQQITVVDACNNFVRTYTLGYKLMDDSTLELSPTETVTTRRKLLWGLPAFLPGYDVKDYSKAIPEWPELIHIRLDDGVLKASFAFMMAVVESDDANSGKFFDKLKEAIEACRK